MNELNKLVSGVDKTILSDLEKRVAALEQCSKLDKYMDRKDVANYLKVSVKTVINYEKEGRLKRYDIGGNVRYKRSEVDSACQKVETPKIN